jgi:selenide,water dikinase
MKWREIEDKGILSVGDAKDMMHVACCSMARLNQNAGRGMVKYHAHAGTDVTGFGLVGHAQNLMDNQIEEVGMEMHTLPCISNTVKIEMRGVLCDYE